jgi:hypothetical protein
LGTWKLSSFYTEDVETKQRSYSFGEHPFGYIVFTTERFFALVTADQRMAAQPPEEQAVAYRTLIAYTGKWRADGDKLVTMVDVAWNPGWVGTEQVRYCQSDGNKLFITSAPTPIPDANRVDRLVIGNLVWEREQ